MAGSDSGTQRPPGRLLDLRSGGGLLLAAGVLCLVTVVLWAQRLAAQPLRIGDGQHVETYGFDLSVCLVPREQIVAAGFSKDGLHTLTDPQVLTIAQAKELDRELRRGHQGKFLVDPDRVIGVVVDGVARAYPLRILNWHEVVSDTLAGRPILVTYNPLCDSAVVFDRRVAGETLAFGVSGLLYNSNLLMYDRRPDPHAESLWSQLQFRAIAGPAAAKGQQLKIMPAAIMHWSDWRAEHPETTVLAPDPSRLKAYENTYDSYFGSDLLRFPVAPLPPSDGPTLKTPVLAVRTTGDWHVFPLPDVAARADADGTWATALDGRAVRIQYRADVPAAWLLRDETDECQVVYAFWFAWYAFSAGVR